ncbi:hypothetical protein [Microbacterium sp. LWH10-1.2]|uniref:hypothetical protein n=1 Tax=Microbacterium sp. LWH10-1.2 TaxID=3135255 RepID=UPI00313887BA
MTSTNRALNRALLLVFGLILLVAGAAALAVGIGAPWLSPWQERATTVVDDLSARFGSWSVDVPGAGSVPGMLPVALGIALLLTILLIVFVFTRGGGRTRNILRAEAAHGSTVVDRNVAEAVLAGTLGERPDVLAARTNAYLVRRARTIELAVTVQRGASLRRVVTAAESAVDDWDALLGTRGPILLHLSDRSWRDGLKRRTRVR